MQHYEGGATVYGRASSVALQEALVALAGNLAAGKPAPDPYRAALQELDLDPEVVLFVGDRVREDYEGPTALGMRAVICTALARSSPPPGTPTIGALSELESML